MWLMKLKFFGLKQYSGWIIPLMFVFIDQLGPIIPQDEPENQQKIQGKNWGSLPKRAWELNCDKTHAHQLSRLPCTLS